jgi:hypothetical protein
MYKYTQVILAVNLERKLVSFIVKLFVLRHTVKAYIINVKLKFNYKF